MSSLQLVHEHRGEFLHSGYLGAISASIEHISPSTVEFFEPTKSFHEDINECLNKFALKNAPCGYMTINPYLSAVILKPPVVSYSKPDAVPVYP